MAPLSKFLHWTYLAALGVFAPSCEDESDNDDVLMLAPRQFVSDSVEGYTLPGSARVHIRFLTSNYFDAIITCGIFAGTDYKLIDGVFDPGTIALTDSFCGHEYTAPDDWLFGMLAAMPRYSWQPPYLVLGDGASTIRLVEIEATGSADSLREAPWDLSGLIDGTIVTSLASPSANSVHFNDTGLFEFTTPCSHGEGTFTATDEEVALSNVAVDTQSCPDDPDDEFAARIDAHMREVLSEGALEYTVDINSLRLTRGAQGLFLTRD